MILAPLVLLSPVLLTGKALFWGTPFLQFIPWRWAAWELLRSAHLPLWTPQIGMGAPLAANYQSALYYPPNWISFFLAAAGGIGWLAWGQALLVAFHLMWAGLGMSLLTRALGLGHLAQVVSGLAFSLSGYLVSRSGFLSINAAAAWVPWVILMVTRLEGWKVGRLKVEGCDSVQASTFNLPTFTQLTVVLAMQLLAGHAQTCWYTLLLAGLWAGFLVWNKVNDDTVGAAAYMPKHSPVREPEFAKNLDRRMLRPYLQGMLHAWFRLGLALALAASLSAVQLLPTVEYLQVSQRAGSVDYDFAMTYSFWPWRFLTLLAPELFGSPAHGNYWGYGNYWEDALYIGMLPVLMALGVVLRMLIGKIAERRRTIDDRRFPTGDGRQTTDDGRPHAVDHGRPSPIVLFLSALILLSFLLALGKNTIIYPWLYRHIPTFDMFQAPTRFSLWAEFGLALLAGWGVNAWSRPAGRGLYWTRLGTAGAFAVTLGAGAAWLFLGDVSPTFLRATALAGLWAMGVGVLSLLGPSIPEGRSSARLGFGPEVEGRRSGIWAWAVVLFICADLLLAGWGLNPGTDRSLYTRPSKEISTVRAMAGDRRIYLPADDEYELKFNRYFSFKSFKTGQGTAGLRGVLLPDAHILEGLASANNFDPLVPGRFTAWMEALEAAAPDTQRTLLNLMDVSVVVKVDPEHESGVRLDSNRGGRRLRWAACAYPASGSDDALEKVLSGSMDLEREAVVEGVEAGGGPICPIGGLSKEVPNARLELASADSDRLEIHVSGGGSGWVVLSDVWYPGWQAMVDGRSVPIARANYLFRAVPVPAGAHEVVFVYRPASFYFGAFLSMAGWAVLAVLGLWGVSQRVSGSATGRIADPLTR
jgi:hypothetical protein